MSEIEYEEKNLVKTKNATLPVLPTYPHNGTKKPNGILERSDTNLLMDAQNPSLKSIPMNILRISLMVWQKGYLS